MSGLSSLLPNIRLALRLAFRELRGGFSGLRVFLACLALGVAAIAAVGSFSSAMRGGIARDGQAILGGDIELRLVSARLPADQRAFLEARGAVSEVATFRAVARKADVAPGGSADAVNSTVVEIKAVDAAYPLYGTVRLKGDGGRHLTALGGVGSATGALVEESFLGRLGLDVGDDFLLGEARLTINGVIAAEPDRVSGGFSIGPRVMITPAGLAATELVKPGSLVRWHYRLRLSGAPDDARIGAVIDGLKSRFPDGGWRLRDRSAGAPGLKRFIDRLSQFLTLIALTALIVGGTGVANGVSAYLERKRETIAVLKCLGARGRLITLAYLFQVLILAAIGTGAGLVLGALAPLALARGLGDVLPVAARAGVYVLPLAVAAGFGFLVTIMFALWPLGRAREIRPAALFRDLVDHARVIPRPGFLAGAALALACLVVLVLLLADDRRFAMIYLGAVIGAGAALVALAWALRALARRITSTDAKMRLALASLARPGAAVTGIILSFGLGLTLMVAVALIDRALMRDLADELPDRAPSFYFLDIQPDQLGGFRAAVTAAPGVERVETVPMLRGRLISLNGVPAGEVKADANVRWVLRGDRGLTYSTTVPKNSEVIEGEWWPEDYDGEPLVSVTAGIARGLGLKIGDMVSVNVLGRPVSARIANLRDVNWGSLAINFVMVFTPNALEGAPHTHLSTVVMDGKHEQALVNALIGPFPNITAIPVKQALDQITGLMEKLLFGLRAASTITLLSAGLVLAGAMAAGQRMRLYEASILKALGARRQVLMGIYVREYFVLGLMTALFALLCGTAAAYAVVVHVIKIDWSFAGDTAAVIVAAATITTIVVGLAGTWAALGQRPAALLRAR